MALGARDERLRTWSVGTRASGCLSVGRPSCAGTPRPWAFRAWEGAKGGCIEGGGRGGRAYDTWSPAGRRVSGAFSRHQDHLLCCGASWCAVTPLLAKDDEPLLARRGDGDGRVLGGTGRATVGVMRRERARQRAMCYAAQAAVSCLHRLARWERRTVLREATCRATYKLVRAIRAGCIGRYRFGLPRFALWHTDAIQRGASAELRCNRVGKRSGGGGLWGSEAALAAAACRDAVGTQGMGHARKRWPCAWAPAHICMYGCIV